MEVDDQPSLTEIMAMTQRIGEKASIFIQNIRYLYGLQWDKHPEKELVHAMVKQLSTHTRRYAHSSPAISCLK